MTSEERWIEEQLAKAPTDEATRQRIEDTLKSMTEQRTAPR